MLFVGLLTKKFLSLIQEAEDGTLDLNHTAKLLQVCEMLSYGALIGEPDLFYVPHCVFILY